jgi:hypothetical protein
MEQQPLVGQGLLIIEASGFTITLRHTTLDRTRLEEWLFRRRDFYVTTHNTHKRWTSMLPAGFEPSIPESEWLQTHSLDCSATGIDYFVSYYK